MLSTFGRLVLEQCCVQMCVFMLFSVGKFSISFCYHLEEEHSVMWPRSSGTIYRVAYPVLTLFQALSAILKHIFLKAFNLL